MIQSVERALDILELLSRGGSNELGLVEIAAALKLDKSTIYNLIKTLQARGYVEQAGPGKKYRQSRKFLTLTSGGFLDERLSQSAEAVCRALMEKIGESVSFVAHRDGGVKILCRMLCDNEVIVAPNTDRPLYSTVSGRCLLAQLTDEDAAAVLENYSLSGNVWPEVASKKDIVTELERIRKNGYAVLRNEKRQVGGIGFIVPAPESLLPLAVGSAMPLYRFDKKRDGIIPIMSKCVLQLSAIAKEIA